MKGRKKDKKLFSDPVSLRAAFAGIEDKSAYEKYRAVQKLEKILLRHRNEWKKEGWRRTSAPPEARLAVKATEKLTRDILNSLDFSRAYWKFTAAAVSAARRALESDPALSDAARRWKDISRGDKRRVLQKVADVLAREQARRSPVSVKPAAVEWYKEKPKRNFITDACMDGSYAEKPRTYRILLNKYKEARVQKNFKDAFSIVIHEQIHAAQLHFARAVYRGAFPERSRLFPDAVALHAVGHESAYLDGGTGIYIDLYRSQPVEREAYASEPSARACAARLMHKPYTPR